MPRWSQVIHDDDGKPTGIVCGSTPYKRCSVPGCGKHADLVCDHPVQRRGTPKVGDTRVLRASGELLYLREIVSGRVLRVSTAELGGKVREISMEAWINEADSTCDRPICSGCAVRVDGRDYCPPHARNSLGQRPIGGP